MTDNAATPIIPVTPPRFMLGSVPSSTDDSTWIVHTLHPVYFARVLATEKGVRLDPYFQVPTETLAPSLVSEALQAGEAFYAETVNRIMDGAKP